MDLLRVTAEEMHNRGLFDECVYHAQRKQHSPDDCALWPEHEYEARAVLDVVLPAVAEHLRERAAHAERFSSPYAMGVRAAADAVLALLREGES